ncbi:HNH endonuclease [Nitratireductor kimnyeongensis]
MTQHDVIPCERCGSTEGTEVHHWAPWHLFDDADEWPTSNLCKSCHTRWHRIVTPNMSTPRSRT